MGMQCTGIGGALYTYILSGMQGSGQLPNTVSPPITDVHYRKHGRGVRNPKYRILL